jgi:hypothetical protein
MSTLTPREVEPGSAWRWVKEAFYLFFSHPIKWGLFYAFTLIGFYVLSLNTVNSFFLQIFPLMCFTVFVFTLGIRIPAISENLITNLISTRAIHWFLIQTIIVIILIGLFSIFIPLPPKAENFLDLVSPLMSFTLASMMCQYYTSAAIKEVLLISYEGPWTILGSDGIVNQAVRKNLSEMKKATIGSLIILLLVLFGNTEWLNWVSLLFGPLLCYIHIMVRDVFVGPTRYENVTQMVPNPI